MKTINTIYGDIRGVTQVDYFPTGSPKSCILNECNEIQTEVGLLIPQYNVSIAGERQKKYRNSISFFENGQIKSCALERQLPVTTSIGTYQCELVTFYENGSINRIFPQNGKIDGFWSEADEGEMAETYSFDFPFGAFEAKIIGLHFYQNSSLKSLTLWPGEKIRLQANERMIAVHIGFSLYKSGELKSVEPAGPTEVKTSIGNIMAFDSDALGIHGDQNSLNFTKKGELLSVKSIYSGIKVTNQEGIVQRIEPLEVQSIIDETETTILPVQIQFGHDQIKIIDDKEQLFDLSNHKFSVYKRETDVASPCSSCSSCNSCG